VALLAAAVTSAGPARANTSHEGRPRINGMLLMNKLDQSRPLDATPGHDPFGGQDQAYRCDGTHKSQSCLSASTHRTVTAHARRRRLLAQVPRRSGPPGGWSSPGGPHSPARAPETIAA
jgi:hypothetical protein